MLTWVLVLLVVLLPIANYISYSRALRRTAARMRARRIAQGLPPEQDTRRRWKTYTRNTRWDRYSN